MKIKRLKKIKVNCHEFKVTWDKTSIGGSFDYWEMTLNIGTKCNSEEEIFMILCHELQEICALEMNVRLRRPDCDSDYMFVYDHRQHTTMMYMFSGALEQFIK